MWFFLSLWFAIFTSINLVVTKKIISTTTAFRYLIISQSFGLFFAIFLLFLRGGIPSTTPIFWQQAFMATIFDFIAAICSFWAIKHSQISLISPISSFNPLFTTIVAMVLLHETPTITKFIGILIIITGSYLLNIKDIKDGWLKPFTKLFSSKAILLFLLANCLWGFTPIFQKQAILATGRHDPVLITIVENSIILLLLTPHIWKNLYQTTEVIRKNFLVLFALMGVGALSQFGAFTAFTLNHVGYVTAIFKLSTLFTIIIGGTIFKEENILERLFGAVVMITGTILLVV